MNDLADEIAAAAAVERAEWQARLEAAVAETLRRRDVRRRQREEHNAARAAGLVHRHRTRLAQARTAPGGAMPQTPDVTGDVLTADVGELRNPELADLASALARVAGWSTLSVGAALTLGTLASQAQQTLNRRRGRPENRGGDRRRTPGAPPSPSVRFPQPPDGPAAA